MNDPLRSRLPCFPLRTRVASATARARLRGVALLVGLALCVAACGKSQPAGDGPSTERPARPNVVLISIDTLRADRLGVYGQTRPLTPNLDGLAQHAWLFEHVQSNANNTGPSHMTMLTGALPPVHGVTHNGGVAAAPALLTLAERLKRTGYTTAAYTDGGFVSAALGFARGFDHFEAHYQRFSHKLDAIGAWLDKSPAQPAFLFVHTYGVHAPYLPDVQYDTFTDANYHGPLVERVEKVRKAREASNQANAGGELEELAGISHAFWDGYTNLTPEDVRYVQDLYDGCVSEVDAGIGRLLAMLDKQGWLDDSWIIVTSDHGEAFFEHGTFQHRQLYEEELHVPLLIRPPGGLPEGQRIATWASLADLMPTLLGRLGMEASPWMQGADLLSGTDPGERVLSSWAGEYPDLDAQVLDGLKRIRHGNRPLLFFDLPTDPLEQHKLDNPPGAAQIAERTDAQARQSAELRTRVGEPVPAEARDAASENELRALGYIR